MRAAAPPRTLADDAFKEGTAASVPASCGDEHNRANNQACGLFPNYLGGFVMKFVRVLLRRRAALSLPSSLSSPAPHRRFGARQEIPLVQNSFGGALTCKLVQRLCTVCTVCKVLLLGDQVGQCFQGGGRNVDWWGYLGPARGRGRNNRTCNEGGSNEGRSHSNSSLSVKVGPAAVAHHHAVEPSTSQGSLCHFRRSS